MKIIKRKILRKMFLTYEELAELLNLPYNVRFTKGMLPIKIGFTLGIFGEDITIWQDDHENFEDWRVELNIKELEKKLLLLKKERIISEDYVAYQGYEFVIETTNENLKHIEEIINKDYNKLNFLKRLCINKLSKTRLSLKDWNLINSQLLSSAKGDNQNG
jgi:hypothetical protein